jgi:aryl-alcohol dehydrogenase-like predicted oxidoreductase
MSAATSQLVLGTVQFGLAYGIAGRGEVVDALEARRILERAAAAGVRFVDTAPIYGDIEHRLGKLCAGLNLRVVSKIPGLPPQADCASAVDLAIRSAKVSKQRLGDALDSLLLHRGEDLLGPAGDAVWRALEQFSDDTGVRLGVSCYEPGVLRQVLERYPIRLAQIPGNAFDQRIASESLQELGGIDLHVRSPFLQGLLLMPEDAAVARLPAAAGELRSWHQWLGIQKIDRLGGALSLVKGLPRLGHCVVGVESLFQLDAIIEAWNIARPMRAPELASSRTEVIDPRRWEVTS